MNKKIEYYEFLRGIAILMVIAIHTYYVCNFTSVEGSISIITRQTLNCAVPIFLALSGFFLGRKNFNNKQSIVVFWKKQISKVYIPCILWSLPLLVLDICSGEGIIWKKIVYMAMCGYSIYYFIALIMQYYLLLPLLQKHLKRYMIFSILISAISICLVTYANSVRAMSLPLILYAGPFVVWFVFYMLGVYYSRTERTYSVKCSIVIVLLGFLSECIETYFLNTKYTGGVGIKLSAFIYSYGMLLLVLHPQSESLYRKNVLTSFIAYVGKISFGIYLIHCYFIPVVDHFFYSTSWLLHGLLVSLITIVFIEFARKFLPQKITKYIGFS